MINIDKIFFLFRLLKTGLQQNRMNVDRLCTCLSLINQLTMEAQMHGQAVRQGRLSSSNLSLQLKQQTVAQIGRTASFNNRTGAGGQVSSTKHKPTKYKGSRTDSALVLKANQSAQNATLAAADSKKKLAEKSGKQLAKSGRRKCSIMDSFSNIFHALKV